MQIDRREFLAGTVAAASATMMSDALCAQAAAPAEAGSWGYLDLRSEYWTMGFNTREEALAEAIADGAEAGISTGYCVPYNFQTPDYAEACADWLINPPGGPIGNWIVESLGSSNSDGDYEGEFEDEINSYERQTLGDEVRGWLAASLMRAGRPEIAKMVLAEVMVDEMNLPDDLAMSALHDTISDDKELQSQIVASVEAWMRRHNIVPSLRGLTVTQETDHKAPVDLATPESLA